jgi:hypothetical protein
VNEKRRIPTGTQISTRDGSEIDSDLTYKFEKLDRCSQGVFVLKKNQTKSPTPFNHEPESPLHPRYISAFPLPTPQDDQPHPLVSNLAASTS